MSTRSVVVSVATAAAVVLNAAPAGAETAPAPTKPGQVLTFGNDDLGAIGNGMPFATELAPVSVGTAMSHAIQVSAQGGHMLALRRDHTVWAWGYNLFGQTGTTTAPVQAFPKQVPGLSDITSVETGPTSSYVVRADGTVLAWGYNGDGQLGLGDTTDRSTPTVVPGLNGVVRVSAGLNHVLALTSSGAVYTWGTNDYGQLGTGTRAARLTPVKVAGLPAARAVAAGTTHSLAVGSDGSVWAWGDNEWAQLGDRTRTTRLTPIRVPLGSLAKDVAAGDYSSFAVMRSGILKAWGTNAAGQLGLGVGAAYVQRPRTVTGVPAFTSVSSGYNHTLAVAKDGSVYAWGAGGEGELGMGVATANQMAPRLVPGLRASEVSAGQFVSAVVALG